MLSARGPSKAKLGVPPVIARLLRQRGLDDAAAAERFLHPDLSRIL